jgi:hypothetical protein
MAVRGAKGGEGMTLASAAVSSGGAVESIILLLVMVGMVLVVDRLFFRLAMEDE